MIGLLLITHGKLAKDFIEAAETIAGLVEAVECISIDDITDSDKLRKIIEKKISFLDQGEGVLILTDMFGGTPSNVALSFLKRNTIEIVTGINLPMVIAISHNRKGQNLQKIADIAKNAGLRSISLASELLTPNGN
ncbi:MAG: PTS sugar transporter subunit IIA [Thermodesulfobacteriota bacterium]|nr:PTS sugar transporter subunit IIA [Thermodesulfobacteriota bacterium]